MKPLIDYQDMEQEYCSIGQKVLLDKSLFGVSGGTYVGDAQVLNKNKELEILAVVRLDEREQGFLYSKNNSPTKMFISTVVIKHKYLTFKNKG